MLLLFFLAFILVFAYTYPIHNSICILLNVSNNRLLICLKELTSICFESLFKELHLFAMCSAPGGDTGYNALMENTGIKGNTRTSIGVGTGNSSHWGGNAAGGNNNLPF